MIGDPGADAGNGQPGALGRLRRNVVLETVLGIGVLAAVGSLGSSVPASHVAPVWPFPYTLGAEGLVPAYPTTYQKNPERYSALTISRGAGLYAAHCAVCHGEHGYGDGPGADALSARPADLVSGHLGHHTDGDLFWWISRGVAGTSMPGFADRIGETGRWNLIAFLHAQADAETGRSLTPSVEPWRPLVAPDFTFETGSGAQASLFLERGRTAVLLVLYTTPKSLPRLRELQAASDQVERAGARIVASPIDKPVRDGAPPVAAGPEAASSYGLFRRPEGVKAVPAMPGHMEFLIDRQGYLRARWIPDGRTGWSPVPGLLRELDRLAHEPPHPPAPRTTPHDH
jgi:putative copper resistance protein D